jgi:hypothetical protein
MLITADTKTVNTHKLQIFAKIIKLKSICKRYQNAELNGLCAKTKCCKLKWRAVQAL